MTTIKKAAAVVLAVMFFTGIGAGVAIFAYLADVVPAQVEEYQNARD